ncbi:MAG TPA: hypothetical protein VM144_18455 [Aestuariivirga sp.]|nr:hypothetical protein [Aestuariivirga sp.]
MIETPFLFEEAISDDEFKKLGQMLVRWSHIENTIGNCLRRLLRLSMDEAIVVVFPLGLEYRMNKIRDLSKLRKLKKKTQKLFDELERCVKAMQHVRNQIAHGIVSQDNEHGYTFTMKKNQATRNKGEIFSAIELLNYTAHIAIEFRYALGLKGIMVGHSLYASLDRPSIPKFLQSYFQEPKPQKKAKPKRPPRSSQAKSQSR